MIESSFGNSSPWSVGVEEEILIVDAETLEPAAEVATFVREAAELDLPGRIKTELFAAMVELTTGICESAPQALAALAELRRAAAAIADRHGLRLMATGSHPFAPPEEQAVVPEERYTDFVAYAGISARIQGVCGIHVHVGMPDGESCYRTLEAVLPWLPVVLAVSANSPYFAGKETGLASNRAAVLAQLPRSGAPPVFGSYRAWERWVERLGELGVVGDYTRLWWDIRPHPNLGTLEVRMPDQPTSLARTGEFVALVQALAAALADREPRALDPALRGDYQQNRWAALRFGLRSELIHPDGDRAVPVGELAAELLDLVGAAASRLGAADLLAGLDAGACEGDRQLEVGHADGVEAVAADPVARSLSSVA